MQSAWLLALLIVVLPLALKAQSSQSFKVFHESNNRGPVLYASNGELYPVSISLDLVLFNMTFSEAGKRIFVIPAKTEKFKIGELQVCDNRAAYSFKFTYKSTLGDVTLLSYDKSFKYDLPYQKGKSYNLFQGYKGAFSHQNENALDFTMPEGSDVLAAREGVVVQVVKSNTESCPREECSKYNNYLTIMHADGTFAKYMHIKYDGTALKVGDVVKRGDVIAYSGNVGWSSGPHLHFVCFTGAFDKVNTFETEFRVDKGDSAIPLSPGNGYLRDY